MRSAPNRRRRCWIRRLIKPGATIGVLGSGQLGRMLGLVARRYGYRFHVYSNETDSPAGQIADREVVGRYDDAALVREFAQGVDVMTFEFENVDSACAEAAEAVTRVRPAGRVLHITQNRIREKSFLRDHGIPVTPFRPVRTAADLEGFAYPAVLKTADFGYDGKGQRKVGSVEEARVAYAALGGAEAILEEFIAFRREVSVVGGRNEQGQFVHFGVIENEHANHILDVSRGPVAYDHPALGVAERIFEELDVVGVLCVEMFELADGSVLVNELAPRTHNSGHLTIESCDVSQFELQLRTICDLPVAMPRYVCGAGAMANLLGDVWSGGEPNWERAIALPVALHLYGKREPRAGRKMGHITAAAATPEEAAARVRQARALLR